MLLKARFSRAKVRANLINKGPTTGIAVWTGFCSLPYPVRVWGTAPFRLLFG